MKTRWRFYDTRNWVTYKWVKDLTSPLRHYATYSKRTVEILHRNQETFSLEQATKAQRGSKKYSSTLSLTSAKISPLPRFNPRTVQPTLSRYTDWAIRAHVTTRRRYKSTKNMKRTKIRCQISNFHYSAHKVQPPGYILWQLVHATLSHLVVQIMKQLIVKFFPHIRDGKTMKKTWAATKNLIEKRKYWKLKEEALDHTLRIIRFERGYGRIVRQTRWWWWW